MPAPARRRRPCAPARAFRPRRSTSSTTCCASSPSSTARSTSRRSSRAAGRRTAMQEFAEYKANRAETPPDLLDQIPYVRRVLEAMRIPILEYSGFEADDVIGTLARRAEEAGYRGGDRFERQGHAATGDDACLHAESGQGRRMVRPGEGEGVHGRAAGAGGRPAGAEGRRHRQHSGRAGDRRQGREGPDRAVRVGGGGARAGRRGGAQDVPREPAEQRRAHPHEQAAGDDRRRMCRSSFRSRR